MDCLNARVQTAETVAMANLENGIEICWQCQTFGEFGGLISMDTNDQQISVASMHIETLQLAQ